MIKKDFWKNKNVLVTGHTGFKGSWLTSLLLTAGARVTGYSLEPYDSDELFSSLELSQHINHIVGDIRDLAKLQKTFEICKPDIVFHLAAQPLVRASYELPVETYQVNVMGTVNVLECARKLGGVASIVNVTTDKVYENKEWYWGYRETDRLNGFDPYSNSKSCSELVTSSYANSFFNSHSMTAISTARSGNVIGGGDFAKDRIIPDCVRAIQKNETLQIRNPLSMRPYQHVLDCLSGYLLLAQKQYENKQKYSGSYNFGPSDQHYLTTSKLVESFYKSWGLSSQFSITSDSEHHEANVLKLDCSKAKSVLGWEPFFNTIEAVELSVQWYKEHINNNGKEIAFMQIDRLWDINNERLGWENKL